MKRTEATTKKRETEIKGGREREGGRKGGRGSELASEQGGGHDN